MDLQALEGVETVADPARMDESARTASRVDRPGFGVIAGAARLRDAAGKPPAWPSLGIAFLVVAACTSAPASAPVSTTTPMHSPPASASMSASPILTRTDPRSAVVAVFSDPGFSAHFRMRQVTMGGDVTEETVVEGDARGEDVRAEVMPSGAAEQSDAGLAWVGGHGYRRSDSGDWEESSASDAMTSAQVLLDLLRPVRDGALLADDGDVVLAGRTLRHLVARAPVPATTGSAPSGHWDELEVWAAEDGRPVRATMRTTVGARTLSYEIDYLSVGAGIAVATPPVRTLTGTTILEESVGGQRVRVVRDASGRLCGEVTTTGRHVSGCPDEGSQLWFGGEVEDGKWAVLLLVNRSDPAQRLSRLKVTTVEGATLESAAAADGAVVLAAGAGTLDRTWVWTTSGGLWWQTWPPYEEYR